jgi:hypothetical protein
MDNQSDKIYINLAKNKDWKSPADKLPVYVGPKNMKHPFYLVVHLIQIHFAFQLF